MKAWLEVVVAAGLAIASSAAGAQQVATGRLELQWGDPPRHDAQARAQLRVTLVADDGRRIALDPAQARRAAGDLYALAGRRVGASLGTAREGSGGLDVDAIVPASPSTSAVAPSAVLGTTRWVTLMCRFGDIATEQKPLLFFQTQYGNSPGMLGHFWREVSFNKIDLSGSSAYGWVTLPHPRAYYFDAAGKAKLDQLFVDCTAAADAQVDFAANGGVQGINMMFNGELDGYAWGGGHCARLDGLDRCWSSTWNPPWSFGNLAPLAHEMGHGYGLPHANNSDGDTDEYDNPWDVMSDSWSNATTDATYGTLPKHLGAYHRDRLGWVDAARKVTVDAGTIHGRFLLDRASLAGSSHVQMIVVRVPGDPSTRYYTIEARGRVGTYESNLAGNAVIVHQVDTTRANPAWSMDASVPPADRANNEGSMFKPGETWVAPGNAFRMAVESSTATGFVVSVCGPARRFRVDACSLPAIPAPVPKPRVPAPVGPMPPPHAPNGRGR